MNTSTCEQINDDLDDLVAGDRDAIARHVDHLAHCDTCRDARHDATQLAARLARAGSDHVAMADLADRVLAKLDLAAAEAGVPPAVFAPPAGAASTAGAPPAAVHAGAPATSAARASRPPVAPDERAAPTAARRRAIRPWLAITVAAGITAAGLSVYLAGSPGDAPIASGGQPEVAGITMTRLTRIDRAAHAPGDGIEIRDGNAWRALHEGDAIPAGAELRTDDRTRAELALADGTRLVIDHRTGLSLAAADPRHVTLTAGRLAADVAHIEGHPAAIETPMGRIDVTGTRFTVTATDALTAVQVTRGTVVLSNARGQHDQVRAGEEGTIDRGVLAVAAVPALARDAAWSELPPPGKLDAATSGIGALRAYKPGESRDRDWNLALAGHDVKVRIVGPIARTEVTETFRNDSAATLEGVYQFPLPGDAQIDGLQLDAPGKPGQFIAGAFVDKERGARIWRGVIDRAAPRLAAHPAEDIIWVEGRWRDPALLDWKRGGRFELRVFPIPARGTRTIKVAYTQVVTPRGPWRQYVYPLSRSQDGSTVADKMTVDVEIRGAAPGLVRTTGYDLVADPDRSRTGEVSALTLAQSGFVPRGDLVVEYLAADGDAELRAWTFAGGAAVAPDEKLAGKAGVGIDPRVIDAQRRVAGDLRPTAVVALHPRLPRWTESRPRDYAIVVDASQSMVGERYARATELVAGVVAQMDRRDRFTVLACDSECRRLGDLRAPSPQASTQASAWLARLSPAGASDLVAAVRAAGDVFTAGDRDAWILYIGDGFASTGFRRVADVERAVHQSPRARLTTIAIGTDADAAVLQAAARGGGGSYLAWVPGQQVATAAAAALEETSGSALRDAVVELPAGMSDAAPAVLPTIRAGDEVLLGARLTGEVSGDVILRGTVGGSPFEQRYPIKLAVSTAAGNAFVPRLWATLAIGELERNGQADDRAKIVGLSQGYGVMSRETSLLVLESQAMFDAFGVDRGRPQATWTGEEPLDEVAGSGAVVINTGAAVSTGYSVSAPAATPPAPATTVPPPHRSHDVRRSSANNPYADDEPPDRGDWIQLRRIWVRVPSISPYNGVAAPIEKAITDAESALLQNPDSREKHRALAQALAYAGELDRALDIAKKWIERDALDPEALGTLADIYGRAGDRERGLRTLAGLVDLDADKVALHERMVTAYEQVGRLSQACAHRIAIASLPPGLPAASAAALRCLRNLGRDQDAALILRALPDDAARAKVEKAALVTPFAAPVAGDLIVKAHWDGGADLDLSVVSPAGARMSWMDGRGGGVATEGVTSADHEALAVKSLRRGTYLIEVGRASAGLGPVRGTIEIAALGAKQSLPFELVGDRAIVGRISIALHETFEDLDGNPVTLYNGPGRRIISDTQIR